MITILLTTDFSENAMGACQYAMDLFEYANAKFILLNTYSQPRSGAGTMKSMHDVLRSDSKRRLIREQERLLEQFNSTETEFEVLTANGPLTAVVEEVVKQKNVDLVVVGAKGMSGIERAVAGSNTISIINKIHVPLLVVPNKVRYKPPEMIAFAMDNVKLERPELLNVITGIAKNYEATIKGITVHTEDSVSDEPSPEELQLDDAFKNVKHSFDHKSYDNIVSGIDEYIHEENADILVVVARKYNFFERLFHKSITKTLSILADIPMIVLPDAK